MPSPQPLADVVKETAQIEDLSFLPLPGQLSEKRQSFFEFPRFQALQLPHQPKRVLVYGINMIQVVKRHAQEAAKLRDKGAQDARAMHLRKCLINAIFPLENLK